MQRRARSTVVRTPSCIALRALILVARGLRILPDFAGLLRAKFLIFFVFSVRRSLVRVQPPPISTQGVITTY
jgi:hypothetical protein